MLRKCVLAGISLGLLSLMAFPLLAANEEGSNPKVAPAVGTKPAEVPAASETSKDAAVSEQSPGAVQPSDAQKTAEAAKTADDEAKAPAAKPVILVPTLKVSIDLATQTMSVSEHGSVKYSWPISSGTSEHPTPRGTFHPQWTAKMWYSRKYDNAPMPNAVFINGGVAIHATPHVRALGRPASHGCIRLAPTNAATFYKLVQQHGLKMTRVSVYGTPKWRAPAVASRSYDGGYAQPRYQKYNARTAYNATSAYDWGIFTPWKPKPKAKPPVVYYYPGDTPRYKVKRTPGSTYARPRRYYYSDGYGW